jgi:hypothetical protein
MGDKYKGFDNHAEILLPYVEKLSMGFYMHAAVAGVMKHIAGQRVSQKNFCQHSSNPFLLQ